MTEIHRIGLSRADALRAEIVVVEIEIVAVAETGVVAVVAVVVIEIVAVVAVVVIEIVAVVAVVAVVVIEIVAVVARESHARALMISSVSRRCPWRQRRSCQRSLQQMRVSVPAKLVKCWPTS